MLLAILGGIVLLGGCATAPPEIETYPNEAVRRITVDGVRINYFDYYPESDGIPILFLHGYSGAGFEAQFIHEYLGPHHRLIAPDFPGAGLSEKPEVDYTLDYYLSFVRAFVRDLGLEEYHVVGHSMGGLVASRYVAAEPAGLRRLVLLAPFGMDGAAGAFTEFLVRTGVLVDFGLELHNETIMDIAMRTNIFANPDRIPRDFVHYLARSSFHTPNATSALASVTRNIIAGSHDPSHLQLIDVPVMIIWGEDDRVLNPRYADDFQRMIPRSELYTISECGHLPHVEQPGVTARMILDFLNPDDPGSPPSH